MQRITPILVLLFHALYVRAEVADCSCEYRNQEGGCIISEAAPAGFKCRCYYVGFWTCTGSPFPCNNTVECPGKLTDYRACLSGGGDCNGCEKKSDWSKGLYTVQQVIYALNNSEISPMKPIILAEKDIFNDASGSQSIEILVEEKLSKTSSFSHTGGIGIQVGVEFKGGIPLLADLNLQYSVSPSYHLTYGTTETFEDMYQHKFVCNGAPHKHTRCTVSMRKGKLSVPYTILLKHNKVPHCECKSFGVWTGVQGYNVELSSREVAPCLNGTCTSSASMSVTESNGYIFIINLLSAWLLVLWK